jgi:hypothetical protein
MISLVVVLVFCGAEEHGVAAHSVLFLCSVELSCGVGIVRVLL